MTRIDEIRARWENAAFDHKSFTSCEVCGYGKRYGAVGDVHCRILGDYFTGNIKPPYKEMADECPLQFFRDVPHLLDAYDAAIARAEALEVELGERIKELSQLAAESVKRELALAKIEAEVEHWAKAEEDGRLVVLPCKVGDTVYVIDGFDCDICQVRHERVISKKYTLEDIGKTVFLTHAEAEAGRSKL